MACFSGEKSLRMARNKPEEKPLGIKGLLGLGFDGEDGHLRISRGPNFFLYGGSKDTHERMQHVALKFNEKVGKRGKRLEEINTRELEEIVEEVHDEEA
jgi:hypothetical protein